MRRSERCLCTLCTTTTRTPRARGRGPSALVAACRDVHGLPVHGLPMRRGCAAILCLLACACALDDTLPRKVRGAHVGGGKRGHGPGDGAAHETHGAGVRAGAARRSGGGAPRFGRRSEAAKKRRANAKQGETKAEVPDKASNARRAKRTAKRRARRDGARRDARRDARRTARHATRTA